MRVKSDRKRGKSKIFGFLKKSNKTALSKAAIFIDYEHWYISLDKNYHTKPDIKSFVDVIKRDYVISAFTFFGDFSNPSLQNEMRNIRGYTNDIVETKNGGGYYKKDFTDFIMLDRIYQTAYCNKSIDTYIIFTGDGHFSSAVLFLKNSCHKNVIVYGVKNAFSSQLKTAASKFYEVEPDELAIPCKLIAEKLYTLEKENKNARPTFMKTVDAISLEANMDKAIIKRAMEQLLDKRCIFQYVKKIGKNQVKLLKIDYKKCEICGYLNR